MAISDHEHGPSVVVTTTPCSLCGKDHEVMAIKGYISHITICEDCFRKVAEEWRKERKERTGGI